MLTKVPFGNISYVAPSRFPAKAVEPRPTTPFSSSQADTFVSSNVLFGQKSDPTKLPVAKDSAFQQLDQMPPFSVPKLVENNLKTLDELEKARDGEASSVPPMPDDVKRLYSPQAVRKVRQILLKAQEKMTPEALEADIFEQVLDALSSTTFRVNDELFENKTFPAFVKYLKEERQKHPDTPLAELLHAGDHFIQKTNLDGEHSYIQKIRIRQICERYIDFLNVMRQMPEKYAYQQYLWNPLLKLEREELSRQGWSPDKTGSSEVFKIGPAGFVLKALSTACRERWEKRIEMCHAAMLETSGFYEQVERVDSPFEKMDLLNQPIGMPQQLLRLFLSDEHAIPHFDFTEQSIRKVAKIMVETPDSQIRKEALKFLWGHHTSGMDINPLLVPHKDWVAKAIREHRPASSFVVAEQYPVRLSLLIHELDDPMSALVTVFKLAEDSEDKLDSKVYAAIHSLQSHPDQNVRIRAAWAYSGEKGHLPLPAGSSFEEDLLELYSEYRHRKDRGDDEEVTQRLVGQPIYKVLEIGRTEALAEALETRIRQYPPVSDDEKVTAFETLLRMSKRLKYERSLQNSQARQDGADDKPKGINALPHGARLNRLKHVLLKDPSDQVFRGGLMTIAPIVEDAAQKEQWQPFEEAEEAFDNLPPEVRYDETSKAYRDAKARKDKAFRQTQSSSIVDFLPKYIADLAPYKHRMEQLKSSYQRDSKEYATLDNMTKALDKLR